MTGPLNYLTVQDVIWLNTQITGAPQEFDYARLEDGVFFQYGYGGSADVPTQAVKLLRGLARKQPFVAGNGATALAATLTFLVLNGYSVSGDAKDWAGSVWNGGDPAGIAGGDHHGHAPSVSEAWQAVSDLHGESIRSLAEADSATRIPLEPAR